MVNRRDDVNHCYLDVNLLRVAAEVVSAAAVDAVGCRNTPEDDRAMFVPPLCRRRDDRGITSGGGN